MAKCERVFVLRLPCLTWIFFVITKKKEAEEFLQPTSSPYLITRENWLFLQTRISLTYVPKISISQPKPEQGTVTSYVWTRALQKSYWSSPKLGNTNRRLTTNTSKSKPVTSDTISLRILKIGFFNRKEMFPNRILGGKVRMNLVTFWPIEQTEIL